jgi:hypothetical protein
VRVNGLSQQPQWKKWRQGSEVRVWCLCRCMLPMHRNADAHTSLAEAGAPFNPSPLCCSTRPPCKNIHNSIFACWDPMQAHMSTHNSTTATLPFIRAAKKTPPSPSPCLVREGELCCCAPLPGVPHCHCHRVTQCACWVPVGIGHCVDPHTQHLTAPQAHTRELAQVHLQGRHMQGGRMR